MRLGITVDSSPAIAIWTTKAVQFTSFSAQSVNAAVRASSLGKTQDKRDFMRPGCKDTTIIWNENTARQSCITLKLDDVRWPPELLRKVKNGEYNNY